MRDALLIAAVLGSVVFGYYLMGQLERFLNESPDMMERESEQRQPSCIMLTEDVPDEELLREIRDFRKRHTGVRIMLQCSAAAEEERGGEMRFERKK